MDNPVAAVIDAAPAEPDDRWVEVDLLSEGSRCTSRWPTPGPGWHQFWTSSPPGSAPRAGARPGCAGHGVGLLGLSGGSPRTMGGTCGSRIRVAGRAGSAPCSPPGCRRAGRCPAPHSRPRRRTRERPQSPDHRRRLPRGRPARGLRELRAGFRGAATGARPAGRGRGGRSSSAPGPRPRGRLFPQAPGWMLRAVGRGRVVLSAASSGPPWPRRSAAARSRTCSSRSSRRCSWPSLRPTRGTAASSTPRASVPVGDRPRPAMTGADDAPAGTAASAARPRWRMPWPTAVTVMDVARAVGISGPPPALPARWCSGARCSWSCATAAGAAPEHRYVARD
ncbi:hypothetical protein QJS66_17000 [Kocuria rhizophila]|nr:hypothetical protein QJS66_17000 [Kocuria rhizophila]